MRFAEAVRQPVAWVGQARRARGRVFWDARGACYNDRRLTGA